MFIISPAVPGTVSGTRTVEAQCGLWQELKLQHISLVQMQKAFGVQKSSCVPRKIPLGETETVLCSCRKRKTNSLEPFHTSLVWSRLGLTFQLDRNQNYGCETSPRLRSGTNSRTLVLWKEVVSIQIRLNHGSLMLQPFRSITGSSGRRLPSEPEKGKTDIKTKWAVETHGERRANVSLTFGSWTSQNMSWKKLTQNLFTAFQLSFERVSWRHTKVRR